MRGARGKADADWADGLLGINQINVTLSQGIEGLGSTTNGNPLASRTDGRVDFSKIEATVSRTQPLIGPLSAYVSAYGQYAMTPLLVPEQCGFGGRYFGRAFDPSQLLGDSCIEGVGELRYDIPRQPLPLAEKAQLYGFSDFGELWTRDAALGTASFQRAASAGTGIRLSWWGHLDADLSAAKAIAGPIDDWRFFFVITARN